jgi:putative hemolysin
MIIKAIRPLLRGSKNTQFFTKRHPLSQGLLFIFIQSWIHPVYLAVLPQAATTILVFVLLFLLLISFMVSGAEVALFSLSFKDINLLKTKQLPAARRILKLLEEPRSLLASLLLANMVVNLAIIIICNFLVNEWMDTQSNFFFSLVVKILLVTSLLVLFAEALPKVWAAQNNLRFAYYSSTLVTGIHSFFKGMSSWLVGFTDRIEKGLGGGKTNTYSLEQLDQAIELTTPQDATEEEKNILKGIIKFGNITVRQVMKSRLDVHGVEASTSFADLVKRVEELHYSRLPVYQENLDHVIGIVHTKDLIPYLEETANFNWQGLLRPPFFVHENKLIEDLLKEFQTKRIHFAVVVDEFGGTEGIVTLEDILEEIIGDIHDEFDEYEVTDTKIDEYTFEFEGKTMINDACRKMGLEIDTFDEVRGDSETLAGLVLELAGEIPQLNQEVHVGDFTFEVLELDKNRILKLKVSIKPTPQEK